MQVCTAGLSGEVSVEHNKLCFSGSLEGIGAVALWLPFLLGFLSSCRAVPFCQGCCVSLPCSFSLTDGIGSSALRVTSDTVAPSVPGCKGTECVVQLSLSVPGAAGAEVGSPGQLMRLQVLLCVHRAGTVTWLLSPRCHSDHGCVPRARACG